MPADEILSALAGGPKTITDLVAGSLSYSVRAPIRAAIDELLAAGQVRRIGLGMSRAFVLADWAATDAFLRRTLESRMAREGRHLIWKGGWDAYHRAILHIDGVRYDVRRTLYRMHRGRELKLGETVRAGCEHERCMSAQCMVVHRQKGAPGKKHSRVTRRLLAEQKRSRSKYGAELVARVKAMDASYKQISRETGMALSTVAAIKGGRLWRDFTASPWAGLGQL